MKTVATKIIPAVKITGAILQFPMLSNEHVPDTCCSMSQAQVSQGCEEYVSSSNAAKGKDCMDDIQQLCNEELEFGEFLKDAAEWL